MKTLKRYFKYVKLIVDNLEQKENLYTIYTEDSPALFLKEKVSWEPQTDIEKIIVEKLLLKNMKFLAEEIRNKIIVDIFREAQYFCFVADDKDTVIIADAFYDEQKILRILDEINAIFIRDFTTKLILKKVDSQSTEVLVKRIYEVENYYIAENGAWIQDFIDNLGDEISKISFRTFLLQRIYAHIIWDNDAVYPILPPKETEAWRKQRKENPPQLPILEHCPEISRDFFHLHSFIYEQYGIEGVVKVKEGDIVIDAGAYIGDTALYFAEKVGTKGKVYAFEVFPESIEHAQDNLKQNNVNNVEMVNNALSDKNEKLYFYVDCVPSNVEQDKNGDLEVQAVSLDSFADARNITINFIKADVEGMELALLTGAEQCIRRDKPVCGIALYHNKEDFIVLPKLLKEYCPEYTFYFRCEAEPVLFAKITTEN